MPLKAGDRLDGYVILAPLGAGGMGEVYRARDERLNRDVALKIVSDEQRSHPQAVARFQREAHAVAALSHPNIVAIHHFATSGDVTYFVMELLEGETLRARIARAQLSLRTVADIGAQLADGLAAAHHRGVIHRDLKPANIVIRPDGLTKILDFGLARSCETAGSPGDEGTEIRTATGLVVGTPGYMSPEQAEGGAVDARTDVFSLGCVLYEMVAGEPPFRRSSMAATTAAIIHDDPQPLPQDRAPAELQRIISRCLRKAPAERYQSPADIALDLRALVTAPASAPAPAGHRLRRPLITLIVIAMFAAALFAAWSRRAPASATSAAAGAVTSLAVLPFENTTRDSDTEFLTDGITEGLINSLSRLPNLHVVARTTSFAYKGKPLDLDRIHRDLTVRAVLIGKVTVRGQNLTVQTDLIDLDTKSELWGQRYHKTVDDPVALEQAIVTDIAERLRIELTGKQQKSLVTPATHDAEAYRFYLKGRYEWNKRSPEGLRSAKVNFQQAIDRDPAFGLAYAGLADTYILMGGVFRLLPRQEALSLADSAARRALAIDPALAEAHASLGLSQANQYRFRSAEKELRTAITLNPNYASARGWLAIVLLSFGQKDEALAQIRMAQENDPLSPLIASNYAGVLRERGDFAAAVREATKALDLNPSFAYAHWQLGLIDEQQGRYAQATERYLEMAKVPSPSSLAAAALARVYAKSGRRAEALKIVRKLESDWELGSSSPTQIAWIHSALGDRDRAFFWMERAFASRDVALRDTFFLHPFCLSEVRTDPRYTELVERVRSVEG